MIKEVIKEMLPKIGLLFLSFIPGVLLLVIGIGIQNNIIYSIGIVTLITGFFVSYGIMLKEMLQSVSDY